MPKKNALILGASRGLGLALAQEFLRRDWSVVATARQAGGTALHELAQNNKNLKVEVLDIDFPEQATAVDRRLQGQKFDLLFVNAGVANDRFDTVAQVRTEDFVKVMVTNALSPMRTVESLQDLVSITGTIGVMSSGQGSVANNEKGGFEIYRASKAALNQLMRSYAARHAAEHRSLLLIAPGWIKTDMGGPDASYTIEEAIPRIVDTIVAQAGKPGLQYLDGFSKTVPW